MLLFAVNADGITDECACAFTTGFVDVCVHLISGSIHLTQAKENLLRTGVVVACDKTLQPGNQRL